MGKRSVRQAAERVRSVFLAAWDLRDKASSGIIQATAGERAAILEVELRAAVELERLERELPEGWLEGV